MTMSVHKKVGVVSGLMIAFLVFFSFGGNLEARPISLTESDTTKPKPKPTINRYTLSGSDTMFQVLFNQIYSPLDVTPRNLEKLKDWLNKSVKQDTITTH